MKVTFAWILLAAVASISSAFAQESALSPAEKSSIIEALRAAQPDWSHIESDELSCSAIPEAAAPRELDCSWELFFLRCENLTEEDGSGGGMFAHIRARVQLQDSGARVLSSEFVGCP